MDSNNQIYRKYMGILSRLFLKSYEDKGMVASGDWGRSLEVFSSNSSVGVKANYNSSIMMEKGRKAGSYSNIEAVAFNKRNNFVFKVYPNPFSYETTFLANESLKNASLIVYNSYRTVRQINNISGQKFTFQRGNLSSGIYWIKLVQDEKVIAIEKLIIAN